ncbi:MAG: glycoside hydrolase family 43 protein [Prolixibacteraceae bacterium]
MNRPHRILTNLLLPSLFVLASVVSCTSAKNNTDSIKYNNSFHPGEIWLDTDSVHINAHGGGILVQNGTYYWFGEHKTKGRGGNSALVGISCYSSTDLYNWKNEGIALASVSDTLSDITKGCVMERPKVIFNQSTQKYVMWFHLELKGKGYSAARTGLAISDHISGPYQYIRSLRPNQEQWPVEFNREMQENSFDQKLEWWTPDWYKAVNNGLFVQGDFHEGQMSRDMTLFVDDDGKAYHIHSSEENLTIHISELTDDNLDFTGRWTRIFPAGHNEAPALFKHKDNYYMITSGCTGWDPNAARLAMAPSIWGPWKALGNPCIGEGAELTFHAQSTFVLPVSGHADAFIFMADRWRPKNPIDGRYIWLPISFENENPRIKWYDEWDLSVFKDQ